MATRKKHCQIIFTSIIFLTIAYDGYDASSATTFIMIQGGLNNCAVENVPREEDLEYPGNNQKILISLKQKWQNYYNCLLQKEKEEKPEIRRLLAGQYTELACDICPRPFQNYEELIWKYKPLSPETGVTELEYLDLTPELTYTRTKALKIYNAVESLAGLYVCYQNGNVVSVYILEVSKNDTTEMVETMRSKDEFSLKLGEKCVQIYYQWSQWTECSACGRIGKKFKYGTCFVQSKQVTEKDAHAMMKNTVRRTQKWITVNMFDNAVDNNEYEIDDILKQRKKKIFKNSTTEDRNWENDIIEKFSTGIPCASQYLPTSAFEIVNKLKFVKVLVKYCWEPCKETEMFEVFDNSGNLIEWANNMAGIYSVFQKIPPLPHDIERRTIAAEFGTDIIIQCPGLSTLVSMSIFCCVSRTLFTNTPITWRINRNIIFPDIVANESGGRFTIDLVNRINLKKLRQKDTRIYSCWQKDKLVGTVHLNVEKKFQVRFDHHMALVGIIAVTGAFLLVGSKVLTRELKMRKKY